ncbi:MAG: UDP-N-acetylmuramate dehydrogenase [Eubacterium sp.]|nr:UDP-N-acetylmuramate dehydrogenase [Eubacterium sp.]
MKRIENADMSDYTSFRCGGRADLLLIPDTIEELEEALREAGAGSESGSALSSDEHGSNGDAGKASMLVLGNGSDTLVRDGGYRGTVIKLGDGFSKIEIDGDRVTAGSAALLSQVARAAAAASLSGLEPVSGIPGSIGGAVFMNAGAYGGEMKDVLESVKALKISTGEIIEIPAEELDLSYRHSIFTESGDMILSAVMKLTPDDKDDIEARMKDYTDRRNDKQPLQYPSAGSFFKRPEGYFAGKLIQDAGLKGLTVGGAQVSEKHSGFIINRGGATASDILHLMRLVQNTVYDKFGVMLEPEVRIVGEDPVL